MFQLHLFEHVVVLDFMLDKTFRNIDSLDIYS